jgi:dTDP-D-glucose 4,6-dehydratase
LKPLPSVLQEQLAKVGVRYDFFQGNVTNSEDLEEVCKRYRIKIVHAAAITADAKREATGTQEILETNLMGSVKVFECALKQSD